MATEKLTTFWVPEHADLRLGLYRARNVNQVNDLGEPITMLWTANIHAAMQFKTKKECEEWIAQNPKPRWIAVEHGVYGNYHVRK